MRPVWTHAIDATLSRQRGLQNGVASLRATSMALRATSLFIPTRVRALRVLAVAKLWYRVGPETLLSIATNAVQRCCNCLLLGPGKASVLLAASPSSEPRVGGSVRGSW